MFVSTRFAVLALSLALAACGEGGDDEGSSEQFLGTYRVTSHRENRPQGETVPCGDPGSEVEPGGAFYAPVFAVAVDSFFEDPNFLVFQTCEEDGTGCVDTSITLERSGDHLEATSSNTQTSGGICSLYAGQSRFTLDGDVATLEDRNWYEFDHPASDCTRAAADAMVGGPDCRDVAIWVGTRL